MLHLGFYGFNDSGRVAEQHHLRIRTVLGLREQVGRNESGGGGGIGNNQDFGRPGGHVDGDTVFGRCELLRGRNVPVAGTKYLVHRGNRIGTQGHGRHGLCPAGLYYSSNAQQLGHKQDNGAY